MTTYVWPQTTGWLPSAFEMRLVPNVLSFVSQYDKSQQSVDLLGERWRVIVTLPFDTDPVLGAAREAFFDRLKGPVNYFSMGHLARKLPAGTLRDGTVTAGWVNNASAAATWLNASSVVAAWSGGAPALRSAIAQLGNIAIIQAVPGATLRAGDQLGLGGLLVRTMADAGPAGSDGLLAIEFAPRSRDVIPAYTAVVWNYPTAIFRLVSSGVPVQWRSGQSDSLSFEAVEAA